MHPRLTKALQEAAALLEYQGDIQKVVGKEYRLTWRKYGNGYTLEELPAKGKRRLIKAEIGLGPVHGGVTADIVDMAKLSPNDTVQEVMDKILKTAQQMASEDELGRFDRNLKWWVDEVSSLKVEPEGQDPIDVQGADFGVSSSWTEFSSYSPDSDFQQSDPYYSKIVSKSSTSARKLYRMLRANPEALKNLTWHDFSRWLQKNGINYSYEHSVWH